VTVAAAAISATTDTQQRHVNVFHTDSYTTPPMLTCAYADAAGPNAVNAGRNVAMYLPPKPAGIVIVDPLVWNPSVSVVSVVHDTAVKVDADTAAVAESVPSNRTSARRAVGNVPVVSFAASTPEAIWAFETVPHADVPEPVPPRTVFAVGVDAPVPTFDSTATTASPVF